MNILLIIILFFVPKVFAKNYAVIKNNTVENIVVWDGVSGWKPPQGSLLVELTKTKKASIGDLYDGENFSEPKIVKDTRGANGQFNISKKPGTPRQNIKLTPKNKAGHNG